MRGICEIYTRCGPESNKKPLSVLNYSVNSNPDGMLYLYHCDSKINHTRPLLISKAFNVNLLQLKTQIQCLFNLEPVITSGGSYLHTNLSAIIFKHSHEA